MGVKPQTAKNAALSLLSRREHSRHEIQEKLERRFSAEAAAHAVAELTEAGLISDRRFTRAYLSQTENKFGREKLRQNLLARGVSETDIDHALSEIDEDECRRAGAVLAAKFGDTPLTAEKSRARAGRFLHTRGFLMEDIECAVERHNRRAAGE